VCLWHDANQNGISDRGEVRPLADYGIVAISCAHEVDTAHAATVTRDRAAHRARRIQTDDHRSRQLRDRSLGSTDEGISVIGSPWHGGHVA
jgi:hypothetical protein